MQTATLTASGLAEAAEQIIRAVGYHGLSFRDLGKAVGITSASVHYHFPTKGRLGAAVARRYTDRLLDRLREIEAEGGDPARMMAGYVAAIRAGLAQDGRMCLCGMLAAEIDAVPDEVKAEVRRFVDLNVRWIADRLSSRPGGRAAGSASLARAMAIFAALEGAMLVARGTGDLASFDAMAREFEQVGLLPGR